MKTSLRISLLLNLALLGGLVYLLTSQRRQATTPAPALSEAGPAVQAADAPRPAESDAEPSPFRWSQLESSKAYQAYIANLRTIGCPEPTIEDIVRGDTARAFSWERKQLRLDGSGDGPWSRARELQLVASLLGAQPPNGITTLAQNANNPAEADLGAEVAQASGPSQDTPAESPSYPLFLQNANWKALGFTAEEQAAIAQVRQQFQNEISGLNQNADAAANQYAGATSADDSSSTPNPSGTTALTRWQKALQDANQQLRDLMGAEAYMAYEQQQYYAWYQPQAAAAAASGKPLAIDPAAFSLK